MTKTKAIVIGALILALLAFGLVALAGGGFGRSAAADGPGAGVCMQAQDSDGDGIPNCDDPDWTRPLDGTGYGAMNRSHARDGDGAGRGMQRGLGNGACMGVSGE